MQWQPLQRTPFDDCVCVFVWSVHGALLLPTIWGLPLCVFVRTYGVLLVPVCMHSDYKPRHNIYAQLECADYASVEDTS